jgi:hypothetical protein
MKDFVTFVQTFSAHSHLSVTRIADTEFMQDRLAARPFGQAWESFSHEILLGLKHEGFFTATTGSD